MKKIICIFILVAFCSCNSRGIFFGEYFLYKRDKSLNYPKEKLSIKFINETSGIFINSDKEKGVFKQDFSFSKIKNNYLIINNVNERNLDKISFKQGDTIVITKNKLLFFYNGNNKYLLSFKKH